MYVYLNGFFNYGYGGLQFIFYCATFKRMLPCCFYSNMEVSRTNTQISQEKKTLFFYDLKNKYKNLMRRKKNEEKKCMLCSVLVNIDQQKKVISNFC